QPVLHPGVLDPAARDFPGSGSVDEALDDLDAVATTFADRIARMAPEAWARTGTVAGARTDDGGPTTVTALDVLREAIATAIDDLKAADELLASLVRAASPPGDADT